MKRFTYEVTRHPASHFRKLAYFCSGQGECTLEELPDAQVQGLQDILVERGEAGWEAVQAFPGRDGFVIIWKKALDA